MGRSSTLPTHSSSVKHGKGLGRSNTILDTPSPTQKHHSIHIPHVHIPFTNSPTSNSKDHAYTPNSQSQSAPKTSTSTRKSHEPLRTTTSSSRPGKGLQRQTSVHTRYMTMLLAQDTIPRFHTILAATFTWILLAGFLVFPGTFTSLQSIEVKDGDEAGKRVLAAVKNVKLIYVGAICCGVGAGGMIWLWLRHRTNFVWLLNRIFLPGCLNSLAGLISTLIAVYSQQKGQWSTTAWITAAVTGGVMVITGVLFGLYNFWLLEKVKRKHEREMGVEDGFGAGPNGEEEGLKEKMDRKTKEPALEPGSVI